MCGISLIISNDIKKLCNIIPMNSLIKHRGPDSDGCVFFNRSGSYEEITDNNYENQLKNIQSATSIGAYIALGHRRLSIVDLSNAGHQPMSDSTKRYWITYNGEVFNFQHIRNELESLGHNFHTKSDTEVIINSYKQWGTDCLHRFNGMWAFAIYDNKDKKLFIARDRFGIKPLYFWTSPEGDFALASEIKQFTTLDGWFAFANNSKAIDFLATGSMDYDYETMFDSVYQVLPGHYAEINLDNVGDKQAEIHQVRWYVLPNNTKKITLSDASSTFRRLFIDSVKLRNESEVPVGSCLSGGLDSSSVVCAVNELLREKGKEGYQKTFTMLSDNPGLNESKWVKAVIDQTGAQSFSVIPDAKDCLNSLREIVWHQDEPFGSLGIYGQNKVFQIAAEQKIKVMLDGQGSDEYLAGYDGFYSAYMSELLKAGRFIKFYNEFRDIEKFRGYGKLKLIKYLGNAVIPRPIKNKLKGMMGYKSLTPSWLNVKKYLAIDNRQLQKFNSVKELSIDQLSNRGIRALLHWEDRNSMAYSIEARVPFLDYRLVEYALSLPTEMKIENGITKKILRTSMRGILPDVIADRQDKLGFSTDSDFWMTVDQPADFRKLLCDAVHKSNGLISARVIDEFDSSCKNRNTIPAYIWRIICFGIWLDVFNVKLAANP
jgi:asparagine synthase (glutamine-hydrolysing)